MMKRQDAYVTLPKILSLSLSLSLNHLGIYKIRAMVFSFLSK